MLVMDADAGQEPVRGEEELAGLVRPDQVSIGVLIRSIPRSVVDDVVAELGVGALRDDGKLPPPVVAYLVIALCMFPKLSYQRVIRRVTGALDWMGCWDASWKVPSSSALTQARQRLGPDVMRRVFERIAVPIAGETGPLARQFASGPARWAFLGPWRLVSIDGFDLDLPDTGENAAEFGYSGGEQDRSAFPKARVVTLSECGTHAFLAAQVDAWKVSEQEMAGHLYPLLQGDELLLADRNFYSFEAWNAARSGGAQLVWRIKSNLRLPVLKALPDGSYLSGLVDPALRGARRQKALQALQVAASSGQEPDADPETGFLVRVVEYTIPDRAGNGSGELIAVITTILDPRQASAKDIAAVYHLRWEHETANAEGKTRLNGPAHVLRSRRPDLVRQEIWAWLCLHYAISVLRTEAAQAAGLDPDRISYTTTIDIVRRGAERSAAFPP